MSSNVGFAAYGLNHGSPQSFSLIEIGSDWSHCKKSYFLVKSEMMIVRAGPKDAAYYGYSIRSSSSWSCSTFFFPYV